MLDYQKRMLEEHFQLTERLRKLEHFMYTKEYSDLPTHKKRTIAWQFSSMKSYSEALECRITDEGISIPPQIG